MSDFDRPPSPAEQGRAARDEIFQERRDDEWINEGYLYPTADPTSQDLMNALGHWGEWDLGTRQNNAGAAEIEKRYENGGDPVVRDKHLAVNEIHNHYMIQTPEDLAKLQNHDVENSNVLDLSSAASRVQAVDNLVQNTALDQAGQADPEYAENLCAASSLVGAAVLGGKEKGTEGVSHLLDAMTKNADPATLKYLEGDKDNPGVLSEIRKKIAKGESLTTGDMHLVQRELYNELQANETKDADARLQALNNDPNATDQQKADALKALETAQGGGIQPDTLKKFIGNSPGLQKMMRENDMDISYMRNDPNQQKSAHAVLTIGRTGEGGTHTIYDPQMRDDGQIVMDPTELENYQRAEALHIGI